MMINKKKAQAYAACHIMLDYLESDLEAGTVAIIDAGWIEMMRSNIETLAGIDDAQGVSMSGVTAGDIVISGVSVTNR